MIENMNVINNSVWADFIYQLRYDRRTHKISCSCDAFTFNTPCHHIKKFIEQMKKKKIIDEAQVQSIESVQSP